MKYSFIFFCCFLLISQTYSKSYSPFVIISRIYDDSEHDINSNTVMIESYSTVDYSTTEIVSTT